MSRRHVWFCGLVTAFVALPWLAILVDVEPPSALAGRYARAALAYGLFALIAGATWALYARQQKPVPERALVWLGCVLFALLSAMFGDYQADDAAISWTFADRLASGHGFALNPGDRPVEGFSNPSLVLYLALTHWLSIPVLVASKLLGLATSLLTLCLSFRVMRDHLGCSPRLSAIAVWWIAACTPFTFWGIAGLENPLLALLLVAAIDQGARELERADERPWGSALWMFGVSQTRPEGLGYVLAFGLARAVFARLHRRRAGSTLWFATALVPFAAVEVARLAYFGLPLPNTFYAKVSEVSGLKGLFYGHLDPALRYIVDWLSIYGLALGGAFALVALLEWREPRRLPSAMWLITAMLLSAFGFIFVAGGDFYAASRFLSHAVPVAVMLGARGAQQIVAALRVREARSLVALGALLSGLHIVSNVPVLLSSVTGISVPFQRIADRGMFFQELARVARIENPSLLDPDLGGTSYRTGLSLIDLGGLGDREVARAMRERRYGPEFLESYVFERQKPTFVHYHEPWTSLSGIEQTRGLARDYLPIHAVRYRPLFKDEQEPLPSERDLVRIEAITDASLQGAQARMELAGISVLAVRDQGDSLRVVFRLERALSPQTRARFVVGGDEHPLLYGWMEPEVLPTGLAFVQFVPVTKGTSVSLAVDDESVVLTADGTTALAQ